MCGTYLPVASDAPIPRSVKGRGESEDIAKKWRGLAADCLGDVRTNNT